MTIPPSGAAVASSGAPILSFPSVATLTSGRTNRVIPKNGTVDLWSCSLEGDAAVLERCHAFLNEEERARAGRFVRPEDQDRFTFAHGSLRVVLARYLGVEPPALRFLGGPTGKPALLDQQGRPHVLCFNLSHSHGRMLVAVANGQDVGIDLEQVRTNVEPLRLAERFYTQAEFERIKGRPVSEHAAQFYQLWVAKEAFLKAQAAGIPSLQQCEIVPPDSSLHASVRLSPGSAMQQGWTIQWLNCGPGWQGAVSAYGTDWSVRVIDATAV
jgi:4'-phosphopantetheinyl transferase